MRRHPALQDLSRDHFTALLRALHVRRAIVGDGRAPNLKEAKAALLDLWRQELGLHFEEEETCLVPVMQERGGEVAKVLVDRILAEHAALRQGFQRLEQGCEDLEWHQVASALTAHARWEEEAYFTWFEANLDEVGLQRLWNASKEFRTRTRGPESVGPPPGGRPGGLP